MARVVKRPRAERDLIDIYLTIAADAPSRAANFLRLLDRKMLLLADAPGVGSPRFPAYPDVRLFPVGRYLIFYAPLKDEPGIDVIRVLHASRDWLTLVEDNLP